MMKATRYDLHLKGYVGGDDFDANYVDYILEKHQGEELNVLIDSLGGRTNTAMSIYAGFKRHGNVNVHYAGMNASAATIVGLGAKHVSMDSSAMYLVHKCNIPFIEWGMLNADDLQTLISNIEKEKKNLDKIDGNVAQMYARRCRKPATELLSLMKEGDWLTASEAKEWGFVDELTDYEEDGAPEVTHAEAAALCEAGIPMPEGMVAGEGSVKAVETGLLHKMADGIVNGLRQVFGGSVAQLSPAPSPVIEEEELQKPITLMTKEFENVNALLEVEGVESQDGSIVLNSDEMRSIDAALGSLQGRIDTLEGELSSLRGRMGQVPDGAVFKAAGDEGNADEYADIRMDPVNFMEI